MVVGTVVGIQGALKGQRFAPGGQPITFGRDAVNDVVLASEMASRVHAELRLEADAVVLQDRGSSNGTWVNGTRVTTVRLQPDDQIRMGDEEFRFEVSGVDLTALVLSRDPAQKRLRVLVSGGGPVGLSLALVLQDLLGPRVEITIYDGRWTPAGQQLVWKTPEQGNFRRQQVVTVQSRQYSRLPREVQARLFTEGSFSEMWPHGPDSVEGLGPRNIRIAYIEDQLLALANEKPDQIRLVPEVFDPVAQQHDVASHDVLAICEGSRSQTVQHFAHKFGTGDTSVYALDGKHVQDLVLGLRVKSLLSDPMSVLLTVSQNRFLLNSLYGDGFLNMRLTDQEALEAVGIDPTNRLFSGIL